MTSFAITAYNEMSSGKRLGKNIRECIAPAQSHPEIDEIVVVDDGSDDYDLLQSLLQDESKVKLYHNEENQGVFGNKIEAIARCQKGSSVITCDSDNKMSTAYIDKVLSLDKFDDTWYCPSFARPKFDYRSLIGCYDITTVAAAIDKPMFGCMFNTGNQVVDRDTFMLVFGKYWGLRADLMFPNYLDIPEQSRGDRYWRLVFDANDSFILNMQWLTRGGRLSVVDGLEYDHYYTSGQESNYIRAPDEKAALNKVLTESLRERSKVAIPWP